MDVIEIFEKLKLEEKFDRKNDLLEQFIKCLSDEDDEADGLAESLVEKGFLKEVNNLLKDDGVSKTKLAHLIAELAKIESNRKPCVDCGLILPFVEMLKTDDILASTQACRALGNICYENDHGRQEVLDQNGVLILLELLKSQLKNDATGADKLRTIACGFLLNLTINNALLQQKALDHGVISLLNQYLQHHSVDTGLCTMTLLAISNLCESDLCFHKVKESTLCQTVSSFLETEHGLPHQEAILELFATLAEDDEIKDVLAGTSLCNYLIALIQANTGLTDANSQLIIKIASDLLVLLLTGDQSMEKLFGKGEGPVFIESVKWLQSDVEHLQIAGALAIGNFARNDFHCLRLVEDGIVDILLVVLKREIENGESNVTLQHALLSALRNLAIPATNKAQMLHAGAVETVLGLVTTDVLPVVFKFLGVLRMLIDGQEEASRNLGMNKEFLDRLIFWCDEDGHAGVKGEATRLLSWLVKNSKSSGVMRMVIKSDGLQYLVNMLTSEHLVMQNEALVALTLISSTVLEDAALMLKEADLTGTIVVILRDERTVPEILCNTMMLTKSICCAGNLREEVASSGIVEIIRELTKHDDSKVKETSTSLLSVLDELGVDR